MDRLLHHELRAVLSVCAALALALAVRGLHRGFSAPDRPGALALCLGGLLAFLVGWTLLKATGLKWFSHVRDFEKAVPVEDTGGALPTGRFLRDRPFSLRLFGLYLALALPLAHWEPVALGVLLWSALDWTGQAAVTAHWERRNGLLLWRGRAGDRPWELSVSPRPATRTASGAPPA
ncbi:hypothetical protein [Streptomyces sp. NPDC057794]|uniref:hypothetical protein n=1 Tax=Streptomyces sp. NPDC057794 TaxID=3346251 RepID=UPI0036990A00